MRIKIRVEDLSRFLGDYSQKILQRNVMAFPPFPKQRKEPAQKNQAGLDLAFANHDPST